MQNQVDINQDAADLRKAMKGLGTDEAAIIKIIANRTNKQRQLIKNSFNKQFNRDLIKDLKSELSGKLEDTIIALFMEPIEYDCYSLRHAMKGLGTDEDTLIEILCSRPNWYIQQIHKKYREMYNRELVMDLMDELSGNLRKVILAIVQGARSENLAPNQDVCRKKAEDLFKAGENRLGTDESVFYKILTENSPPEIACIAMEYQKISKNSLLTAIDKEFSGDMKKALKTIVYAIINPSEYFATRVNKAVKGLGTDNKLLIRIIVTRAEIDMPQIKEAYKKLYNKDMVEAIKSDTSGDYKKLLIELCSH
jgi:annexin A7/11